MFDDWLNIQQSLFSFKCKNKKNNYNNNIVVKITYFSNGNKLYCEPLLLFLPLY